MDLIQKVHITHKKTYQIIFKNEHNDVVKNYPKKKLYTHLKMFLDTMMHRKILKNAQKSLILIILFAKKSSYRLYVSFQLEKFMCVDYT